MSGELLLATPDGRTRGVENSYEAIKAALDGATLDAIGLRGEHATFFVDDEGIFKLLPLNVPASIFSGTVLYGPVVLAGEPDDEGDTQPPVQRMVQAVTALCRIWRAVCEDAERKGQNVMPVANPGTLPPPVIVELDDAAFKRLLHIEDET